MIKVGPFTQTLVIYFLCDIEVNIFEVNNAIE